MAVRFSVHSAGFEEHVDEGFDYLMAGLSENADGSGRGMTFQCALTEPDEVDRDTGMDSYCISNELGLTVYGGLREVSLAGRTLRIVFEPEAASGLGLDEQVLEVTLEVNEDSISELRGGLRRTLTYGRENARPRLTNL